MDNKNNKWVIFTNLMTFYIPDCLLNKDLNIRQAWREKTTIFILFILLNLTLIFLIGFIPKILCSDKIYYTWNVIRTSKKDLMIINGKVHDVSKYGYIHNSSISIFNKYLGQDISYMFDKDYTNITVEYYSELLKIFLEYKDNDTSQYCNNNYCHPSNWNNNTLLPPILGDLYWAESQLLEQNTGSWIILYNNVYNMTEYIEYGKPIYPTYYDNSSKPISYYLHEPLNSTILNRIGSDATQLFEQSYPIYSRTNIISFLNKNYYCGKIDTRKNGLCYGLDIVYYCIVGIITFVLLFKFITSLCTINKIEIKHNKDPLIAMIPCYNENMDSLKKTINSVCNTDHPNDCKLLFIVVDGIIKSNENKISTAEIVLEIFNTNLSRESHKYNSTFGSENEAQVLSGFYDYKENKIPYIIIIKTGSQVEINDNRRGNRGKRDSQLILLNYLSKLYSKENNFSELENNINTSFKNKLNTNPNIYKYLLFIDADTHLHSDSIKILVQHMKDKRIVASCGETTVSNKYDSIITAIQVYEYYINYNLNKAFESFFSNITCFPGCFSLYRIKSKNNKNIYIAHPDLIKDYSEIDIDTLHKKNLLQLGEDRYLSTLLLRYFPNKNFKYVKESKCETIVPNTFCGLLIQRRRWVNSTIHNLYELLLLPYMCGIGCFSMKFIVFLDFIITLCLPSLCCYFIYLIIALIIGIEKISIIFIISITTIFSIQILICIIHRKFEYILWLIIYIISLPFWTVVIPIYSIIKMDDFNWGKSIQNTKNKILEKTNDVVIDVNNINVNQNINNINLDELQINNIDLNIDNEHSEISYNEKEDINESGDCHIQNYNKYNNLSESDDI